jgi:excisionase family DNA binding protein
MRDIDFAMSFAIFTAKRGRSREVTPDHLLLGCLRAVSRFGVAKIGPWNIDLETLGVDWVRDPDGPAPQVAYSQDAVEVFDRAALIAKSSGDDVMNVSHMLAAFAAEKCGLMAELKRSYGIAGSAWRAAVGQLLSVGAEKARPQSAAPARKKAREYLSPEEAAEELGIHVQTMRAYVRSGRVPAFRLAGERAIRILRADLKKVLEPLETAK